ncbi:2Fe-2S iron-sulfur cluster-binding protein [Salinispirillum marinum]|uniref:2Fe-2S iron-sulfur cluster-binding protein n=2 Tax=Saccharospirillaceae TaxID=255527 RepID=A0ABV8BGH2_9GAMM
MVTLTIAQQAFEIEPDKTLYEALLGQGLALRKACINGACGVCRYRLVAGHIDYRGRTPYGLDEAARREGFILPCIAYPIGDVGLSELRR